jgi:hypothetical protein
MVGVIGKSRLVIPRVLSLAGQWSEIGPPFLMFGLPSPEHGEHFRGEPLDAAPIQECPPLLKGVSR